MESAGERLYKIVENYAISAPTISARDLADPSDPLMIADGVQPASTSETNIERPTRPAPIRATFLFVRLIFRAFAEYFRGKYVYFYLFIFP